MTKEKRREKILDAITNNNLRYWNMYPAPEDAPEQTKEESDFIEKINNELVDDIELIFNSQETNS